MLGAGARRRCSAPVLGARKDAGTEDRNHKIVKRDGYGCKAINLLQMFDDSSDLVPLLVGGLFEHLREELVKYPMGYVRSSSSTRGRKKGSFARHIIVSPSDHVGHVIRTYRLLNKEFRTEVDRWILVWMSAVKSMMRDAEGGGEFGEMLITLLKTQLSCCFPQEIVEGLCKQIVEGAMPVLRLKEDVVTFMCMCTQRCQIHATNPIDLAMANSTDVGCKGANVCLDSGDFCQNITLADSNTLIYACKRCLKKAQIKVDIRFLSNNTDQSTQTNLARAMFRMARMHPLVDPFSYMGICHATRCWRWVDDNGNSVVIDDQVTTDSDEEVDTATPPIHNTEYDTYVVDSTFWPRSVMLLRNISLHKDHHSIQQMLGLSDAMVQTAYFDVLRKMDQLARRQICIANHRNKELIEDINAHIARMFPNASFPFHSLEEMAMHYPGMAASLRVAVSTFVETYDETLMRTEHAMDIEPVRKAMFTISQFFRVCKLGNSLGLGSAYDYFSGMHVGLYERLSLCWAPGHGSMTLPQGIRDAARNTDIPSTFTNSMRTAVDFFYGLNDKSLNFANFPYSFELATSDNEIKQETTILFRSLNEPKFNAMYMDIRTLADNVCKDVCLPPQISYKYYKQQVSKEKTCTNTKYDYQRSARDWYCEMFKKLVRHLETRCAALDLLGIGPADILHCVNLPR